MTSQLPSPLPERPNLEQLKKQAKSLLHAARARRRERARTVSPAARVRPQIRRRAERRRSRLARRPIRDRARARLRLVECIARSRRGTLAVVRRGCRRVRPLRNRQRGGRALRLLALHPGIAHASLHTELVLGDADGVQARLRAQPSLATQPGGVQNWEPLFYVCHTCVHRDEPARAAGLVAIARSCSRSARTRTPSITGSGIRSCRAPLCGERCARRVICRSRSCCCNEEPTRPTACLLHITAGGGHLGAGAAASIQGRSQRHPRRRAAAALHPQLGREHRSDRGGSWNMARIRISHGASTAMLPCTWLRRDGTCR